jgi:hypothetical protein
MQKRDSHYISADHLLTLERGWGTSEDMSVVWGSSMASKTKKSLNLERARERVYKKWLKRSWRLAPDPVPVRVTTIAAVLPKRSVTKARRRHAQLTAKCVRADPRLA